MLDRPETDEERLAALMSNLIRADSRDQMSYEEATAEARGKSIKAIRTRVMYERALEREINSRSTTYSKLLAVPSVVDMLMTMTSLGVHYIQQYWFNVTGITSNLIMRYAGVSRRSYLAYTSLDLSIVLCRSSRPS